MKRNAPPQVIVMQNGAPCALVSLTGRKRGTALMPGSPVTVFLNRRRARTAIARTQRIAKQLRGSIIDEWPKLKPLFNGGEFKIEPIAKP